MKNTVRAAVTYGPGIGNIKIQEFPWPSIKDRGGIIVKMLMSGVCGTDKHTFKGETKQFAGTEKEQDVPFPLIQGHENVGIIVEIDDWCKENLEFSGNHLDIGDRVAISPDVLCGRCDQCKLRAGYSWCDHPIAYIGNGMPISTSPALWGGFAEYMYVPPQSHVFKVPDSLSDECAMLAELFACAYNVDKAKEFYSFSGDGFAFGDTVVVQGVGPLGMTHMIKARLLGAGKIIAIDTSEFRLNMSKEFGADYVINAANTKPEERLDRILELTRGKGADMVIECVGRPELVPEGIDMLRKGGMLLEPGNYADTGTTPVSIHKICSKNIRIIGQSNLVYHGYVASMEMMLRGSFNYNKLVTHYYDLENTEAAIIKSMDPDSMKVVVCGNK